MLAVGVNPVVIKEGDVGHADLVGHAERDAMPCAIHVGVGAIDGDVVLDSHCDGALNGSPSHDFFQTAKDEGMVRDDQVAASLDSLGHDHLGSVGTQEDTRDVSLGVTHLNARIVPLFLEPQGSILLDGIGDFSNSHGGSCLFLVVSAITAA